MNRLIIVYILGSVLKITGVLLLLPIVTGIIYHESTTMFFRVGGSWLYSRRFSAYIEEA